MRNARVGFAVYTDIQTRESRLFCAVSFQQLPRERLQEFLQNSPPPLMVYTCYARCSVRITHGRKHRGAGALRGNNFNLTALLSERVVLSPRTHCVCGVFVTKRMVPVLGYDCSQRHTCEGTTLNLNINLPTENFHSY